MDMVVKDTMVINKHKLENYCRESFFNVKCDMLKLTPFSKIFILCPVDVVTGGAELLHQLAHILNENNRNAYIVYYNTDGNIIRKNVPDDYKQYNVNISDDIFDDEQNIVILFEAIFDRIRYYNKCQIVLWWLSVDNFYLCSSKYLSLKEFFYWDFQAGCIQAIKGIYRLFFKRQNTLFNMISLRELNKKASLNCYQSEYAQHYLLNNKFSQLLPLTDYINTDFEDSNLPTKYRTNKILYNPKKGFEVTKKLIERAPHLKWVALQNMSRDELINEFQTSKVYIDFGYHPGKDRIPREAALNGCCVITNKRGSANYFEDVAIYDKYKIDKDKSLEYILNTISSVIANYDECVTDFQYYRKKTKNERDVFRQQASEIFSL
jgi:hypothetical protein